MTTEQLQPYCHADSTRHKICTPYRDGEWVIATNLRTLIRVPWVESVHGDIRTDGPPTAATFDGTELAKLPTKPEDGWESIPAETKPCWHCDGIGSWSECEECEGNCEITCDSCGHSHQCEECRGVGFKKGPGETKCDDCDGTGTQTDYPKIRLIRDEHPPLIIFQNYLKLIMDLPGVQIFTHAGGITPHRFTFDGGDGIFMQASL